MARPRKSIISKRHTLEVALRICDQEGLDALSMRRLGREFDVQGISFYHHFKNKEEIMAGVCELALSEVRTPKSADLDWREWLFQNFLAYRRAVLAHPNLLPVLVKRHALGIGLSELNATAGLLAVQGVPPSAVMPLLETLEELALASVNYKSRVEDDEPHDWKEDYPYLHHLRKAANLDHNEIFDMLARAAIDLVVNAASNADKPAAVRSLSAPAEATPRIF